MRKKICTIAVCVMMILIIMPTGVSAETNDWTYDANNRTLTSADQNITLYNVRASNKHLCIEYNNEKSFKAIDLTGKINGGEYIITELGSESFKNCKSLEEIKLPDSVKEIGSERLLVAPVSNPLTFQMVWRISNRRYSWNAVRFHMLKFRIV